MYIHMYEYSCVYIYIYILYIQYPNICIYSCIYKCITYVVIHGRMDFYQVKNMDLSHKKMKDLYTPILPEGTGNIEGKKNNHKQMGIGITSFQDS